MLKLIKENLNRQSKAVALLNDLLEEEFSSLMNRKPHNVTQIEFTIQELMRQIASERMSLKGLLHRIDEKASRLSHIFGAIEDASRLEVENLVAEIDKVEQRCAVQASKNQHLAHALLNQSQSLLGFLHNEIQPKNENVYSSRGRYEVVTPNPSLINGRL